MYYRNCPIKQISLYCNGSSQRENTIISYGTFQSPGQAPLQIYEFRYLQAPVFVERAPGGSDAFPQLRNMVCPSRDAHTAFRSQQ